MDPVRPQPRFFIVASCNLLRPLRMVAAVAVLSGCAADDVHLGTGDMQDFSDDPLGGPEQLQGTTHQHSVSLPAIKDSWIVGETVSENYGSDEELSLGTVVYFGFGEAEARALFESTTTRWKRR